MRKLLGYTIAVLHALLIWSVTAIPFVTSSLSLLAFVFLFDLLTVISWPTFNNKCVLSIIEAHLIGDEGKTMENGSKAYFNKVLGKYIREDVVTKFNVLRPYCMMFFTGCKMLPILASI